MDLAGRIYQATVHAARAGADLETVLSALVRITQSRAALVGALARCDAHLATAPDDVGVRRAREMLVGALGTSLFSDGDGRCR